MGKRNTLLLGVAIIAIGLFVIPSTMSMFVGQHSWFSVRTPAQQYELCERCHQAEVGEWMSNNGAHSTYREMYNTSGCFCHQINESQVEGFGFSNIESYNFSIFNESGIINSTSNASWSTAWRSQATPHAAITIACVDCHVNATAQLANEKSAHKAFQDEAVVSGNANTACMACHTMVGLNITMERNSGGLIIYGNHTINETGVYVWDVNVTINSTRTNTSRIIAANNSY
ncbi:MAG: hypothetical protein Q7J10_01250 [Methanosarcinaceae archaeon]|nr:hypothetical protein [Methanosarcinaceae archaeon]